ncbi:MAG TPA: hypothetical protein VET88_10495, partial [Gammaproteobacteria bacterium]|nr:hypothetical protein [Gammaproteobacteria bacterium]
MNTVNPMQISGTGSPPENSRQAGATSRDPRARMLVVEDDLDISSLLIYTLDNARFDPVAAPDCKTAWEILLENPPDLVLLDWMLPD